MHPLGLIENQLDTSSVVIGFYLVIALLFAIPTYDEGRKSHEGGPLWRIAGLLLCFAWPLLIGLVAFELVRRQRPIPPARARGILHRW